MVKLAGAPTRLRLALLVKEGKFRQFQVDRSDHMIPYTKRHDQCTFDSNRSRGLETCAV
jgi:hypothetical protein